MTIKIFRRSTKNTLEHKSKMSAISHFHVIHEILKTFKMQKLPMYWVQTHTMCSVHVSPDSVQFSCNSDSICTNYHHSYAETHLIFLNEMCNLAYKVGYKCFKSRHIHYKLSPIVHSGNTYTGCLVYVSPDGVQFSCNSDSICANYHHSYAETHLIFLNKMCNLAYKVGYKCFKSRHIHYILSTIVHSIYI